VAFGEAAVMSSPSNVMTMPRVIPRNGGVNQAVVFNGHAGDTVTFNFTYTPVNAHIGFGIIDPNGTWWTWGRTNGSSATSPVYTLTLQMSGQFRIVVQNNHSTDVTITGTATHRDMRTSLRIFQDPSYRANFGNIPYSKINDVTRPFERTVHMSFRTSVFDVNNTILSRCPNANSTTSPCVCTGLNCNTTTPLSNRHHSNIGNNLDEISGRIGNSTLSAVIAASLMCMNSGSSCALTSGGIAPGRWSYNISFPNTPTDPRRNIVNVRIIQHEIGHNYGLPHCGGVTGRCIMNGGFDGEALDSNASINIWCTSCLATMRNNRHMYL